MTTIAIPTKQPKGLYPLFFAEMWERYGFYSVQFLLVLFLTNHFGFTDDKAYVLYGGFAALVYLTPIFGGYVADHLLGFRRAIYLGAIFYIVGYSMLAILEAKGFYYSLACLIVGNGFFKGNVSSLLGTLYHENDPRRDSGFTIFYIGINTGGILASLVASFLAVHYGWYAPFAVAGLGMLVGFINLVRAAKRLGDHGLPPYPERLQKHFMGITYTHLVWIGTILAVIAVAALLHVPEMLRIIYGIIGALVLLTMIGLAFRYPTEQRNKIFALIILVMVSMLYWALFGQMYSSVTLFVERSVDRHIFGYLMPAPVFIGIEGFGVLIFGAIMSKFWIWLESKGYHIAVAYKFAIGLLVMGIAFAVLKLGIVFSIGTSVSAWWTVLFFLLFAISELALSPIGLSMITILAPKEWVGMMMGVWFLSLSVGFGFGGQLARLSDIPADMNNASLQVAATYGHTFMIFAVIGIVAGFIVIALGPWLTKLSRTGKVE